MKNHKNLILAIHIDSAELNLSVGFVENNHVSILAYKTYEISGIDKGGINESKNFETSFTAAIADFLNNDCKVSNVNISNCKKRNIDIDDHGCLAIKKYAINIINPESNELGGLLQSNIIKNCLQRFVQGDLELVDNESICSCTADIAATNLLCSDNTNNYNINIFFGRYSTSLNFIINNKSSQKIYSKKIEIGIQELVNSLNENPQINLDRPAEFSEVYQFLKHYRFVTTKVNKPIKIKFIRNNLENIDVLNNIFILKLQYILHHCYNQFCKLDTDNLRFEPNFLQDVKINILGYMADFDDVANCVSLVFSHKLKEELNQLELKKQASSKNITTKNTALKTTNINLVTGEQSNNLIPTLKSVTKEIIYKDPNFEYIIRAYNCKVQTHYTDLTKYTENLDTANYLRPNIDQFAAAFGLIYNFYIVQPNNINKQPKSFFTYICNFLKISFGTQ